jgi:hypothetical protein
MRYHPNGCAIDIAYAIGLQNWVFTKPSALVWLL